MKKAVALLFLCTIASGQTNPKFLGVTREPFFGERLEVRHPYFEIQVTVTAAYSTHVREVESYVLRNLRSLGDVQIVSSRPFMHLYIAVMDLKTRNAYTGSVMTTVVAYPWLDDGIEHILGPKEDDLRYLSDRKLLQEDETYEATAISFAPVGKISDACERLITSLDVKYLRPSRDLWMATKQAAKQK